MTANLDLEDIQGLVARGGRPSPGRRSGNYLREAMVTTLADRGVEYDFGIQLQTEFLADAELSRLRQEMNGAPHQEPTGEGVFPA